MSAKRKLVVDLAAAHPTWALPSEGRDEIRRATPEDWSVYFVDSPTSSDGDGPPAPNLEAVDAIADAEVYFGYGIPEALFKSAKRLRWSHSANAGVGNALHASMRGSDVTLTNAAGVHAIPMSEHVLACVLYFLRGLDYAVDAQRRATWEKDEFIRPDVPIREMDRVRALIFGVSGIGGQAARRLSALGARCTGVRRRVSLGAPEGFAEVVGLDDAERALRAHDVVVLAMPLTGETNQYFDARRLDLLRPETILVNVARGPLIDEAALAERLANGRIRGAALDVFEREPLASTSPLWQLRNALLTPHISGTSPGRHWPRQLELFLDNWARYLGGRPLRNVVDKVQGY